MSEVEYGLDTQCTDGVDISKCTTSMLDSLCDTFRLCIRHPGVCRYCVREAVMIFCIRLPMMSAYQGREEC